MQRGKDVLIDMLAGFGLFCLVIITGMLGLFLKTMHQIDRESKQRMIKAEAQAERIIMKGL